MLLHSKSTTETRAIAAAIAALLEAGDVVVLTGDLGGGKTTFVQGAVAALGSSDSVTSPTFAIVQEYTAPVPIAHVDVYRLDREQELHDIGFDELVDSGRIVFVEWGERVARLVPADRLVITFDVPRTGGEDERVVAIEAQGASWALRHAALGASLQPWSVAS